MWIMLRCGLVVVIFLALSPVTGGADRLVPRTPQASPPVIVLIPFDSTAASNSPLGFNSLLRQSLSNHLGYLLAAAGLGASLKTSAAPVSAAEALASLEQTSGQEALLLYFVAALHDKPFTARDRHRRRYRAVAEDCLNLTLRYERHRLSSAGWTEVGRGSIAASGEPVRVAIRAGSGEISCEPHEFVIQRGLNALRSHVPGLPVDIPPTIESIPVRVYVSQPVAHGLWQTPEQLELVLGFASRQLEEQFGLRLNVVMVDTLPAHIGGRKDLQDSQAELDAAFSNAGDTLIVVFNRLLDPRRYTTGDRKSVV